MVDFPAPDGPTIATVLPAVFFLPLIVRIAEAELETTDRQAQAKVRLAEAEFETAEKLAEGKFV